MHRLQYLGHVKCNKNLAILTASVVEEDGCRQKGRSRKLGARQLLGTHMYMDSLTMTPLIRVNGDVVTTCLAYVTCYVTLRVLPPIM